MKCPGCGAKVDADAAICPRCDYIIDDSFLAGGGDSGRSSEDDSGSHRRGTADDSGSDDRPADTGEETNPRAHAARRSRADDDDDDEGDPEDDSTKFQNLKPTYKSPEQLNAVEPAQDAVDELRIFFKYLHFPDKLTAMGLVANLLFAFFPWRETLAEGTVLGLFSLGGLVPLASMMAFIGLIVRERRLTLLPPVQTWYVQLGAIGFSVALCLLFIILSWDGRMAPSPVGNFEVQVSSPSIGVFAALLASLLALGGTLLGFRERPSG